MKTRTTVWLILSALLMLGGITVMLCAWMAVGGDFSALNTATYTHNTHTVDSTFDDIFIDSSAADNIRLVVGQNETCKITCSESESVFYDIAVQDGTLRIVERDERKWYEHISFSWQARELIVELPTADYRDLRVTAISGNIDLPAELHLRSAILETVSGDVTVAAVIDDTLSATCTSGNIAVTGDRCQALKLKSVSGDVDIAVNALATLQVETTSGNIRCRDTIVDGKLALHSVSGNIKLERCDGASLALTATSGNIHASLLSAKRFAFDTVSGTVKLPASEGDALCEAETTSGNIYITIVP